MGIQIVQNIYLDMVDQWQAREALFFYDLSVRSSIIIDQTKKCKYIITLLDLYFMTKCIIII